MGREEGEVDDREWASSEGFLAAPLQQRPWMLLPAQPLPAAPVPGPGRAPPAFCSPGATHGERTALGTGGPAQTSFSPHRPGQRGCPTPGIPRSPGEKPPHHPQLTHQTSQLRCRPPPRGSGSPVHGGVIHTVPDTMEIRGRPPASPPPSRSLPRLGSAQLRRPLIPPPSPGSPPPSPAAAAAEPGRAPRPPPAPAPPPLPRLTLSQPRRRRAGLSSPSRTNRGCREARSAATPTVRSGMLGRAAPH